MKKLTQEQIDADIAAHGKWLRGESGGKRADWSECNLDRARLDGASLDGASLDRASLVRASLDGARLVGASLDGASLVGARLVRASLDGARLDGASLVEALGVVYASCSWADHGECGRQLMAAQIDGKDVYYCGCFRGSLDELREYINLGEEKYRASRTIAADFVSARMAEMTVKQ